MPPLLLSYLLCDMRTQLDLKAGTNQQNKGVLTCALMTPQRKVCIVWTSLLHSKSKHFLFSAMLHWFDFVKRNDQLRINMPRLWLVDEDNSFPWCVRELNKRIAEYNQYGSPRTHLMPLQLTACPLQNLATKRGTAEHRIPFPLCCPCGHVQLEGRVARRAARKDG